MIVSRVLCFYVFLVELSHYFLLHELGITVNQCYSPLLFPHAWTNVWTVRWLCGQCRVMLQKRTCLLLRNRAVKIPHGVFW